MTKNDIFKIWAPADSIWSPWVRPVPFAAGDDFGKTNPNPAFTMPHIGYIGRAPENTAVILDLPGCDSIKEGLALAGLGFRPVPLCNGTNAPGGAMALVDNRPAERALIWGAKELEKLAIDKEAPPAFLLDSNRTHRYRMNDSVFDNSWDIYDQDMPPAEYFTDNGIYKIIVRGGSIQRDLAKILYTFQKKGITTLFTKGYEAPKITAVKKPARRYRFM
jgi:hypothetical protein